MNNTDQQQDALTYSQIHPTKKPIPERLAALLDLYQSGIIDQAEYNRSKELIQSGKI